MAMVVLAHGQTEINGRQLRGRNKPSHLWPVDFLQGCQDNSTGKVQSLHEMMLGKLDIQMQNYAPEPVPYTIHKISDKRSRPKTIELLEENTAVNLYDLGQGNGFLDVTTKAQHKKTGKPDFIKIKGFCASQGPVRK